MDVVELGSVALQIFCLWLCNCFYSGDYWSFVVCPWTCWTYWSNSNSNI